MKRAVIERAVKVNFGSMEPVDWKPTMEAFCLIKAGYEVEKEKQAVINRHANYFGHEWYQRKFKLVENYLRIYGSIVLILSCMLFTSCSPHLNPNRTPNRVHGLTGKEAVKKQQKKQFVSWKTGKLWK